MTTPPPPGPEHHVPEHHGADERIGEPGVVLATQGARLVVRWRPVHDIETLSVLAGIILAVVSPVDANDRPPTESK
jgi:hypothetical protein